MWTRRSEPPPAADEDGRGDGSAARRLAATDLCMHGLYYRTVVRFLERRLPAGADVEGIANDVMRSVFDPAIFRRAFLERRGFRELLLAATRYHLYRYVGLQQAERWSGKHRTSKLAPPVAFDDLGTLDPGTDEERRDFLAEPAGWEATWAVGVIPSATEASPQVPGGKSLEPIIASRKETTVRSTPTGSSGPCECPCPRCAGLRQAGVACACPCGSCVGRKAR